MQILWNTVDNSYKCIHAIMQIANHVSPAKCGKSWRNRSRAMSMREKLSDLSVVWLLVRG